MRILDRLLGTAATLHVSFFSDGTIGDTVLLVEREPRTAEDVVSMKEVIQGKYDLKQRPVLIAWRRLDG